MNNWEISNIEDAIDRKQKYMSLIGNNIEKVFCPTCNKNVSIYLSEFDTSLDPDLSITYNDVVCTECENIVP